MTDDQPPEPSHARDQLREEAALWFARMRGEEAERHRPAFEAWLARGAVHRAAYNRIGEVFAAGKVLKRAEPAPEQGRAPAEATRPWAGASVLLVLVASVLLVLVWQRDEGRRAASDMSGPGTAAGIDTGNRPSQVRLADHASATLDVDGRLIPAVEGAPAIARLERGRARFDVTDGKGGQTVLAGPGVVVASSGTFDLWLTEDGSLDAQVWRGSVDLRPAVLNGFVDAGRSSIRLAAGQHYRLTRAGEGTRLSWTVGRAWTSGLLEFRGTPLLEVFEEANRYTATKLVAGDVAIARMRVSGRFRVDQPQQLAERIAVLLSLQLDRSQPGRVIFLERKKSSASP